MPYSPQPSRLLLKMGEKQDYYYMKKIRWHVKFDTSSTIGGVCLLLFVKNKYETMLDNWPPVGRQKWPAQAVTFSAQVSINTIMNYLLIMQLYTIMKHWSLCIIPNLSHVLYITVLENPVTMEMTVCHSLQVFM